MVEVKKYEVTKPWLETSCSLGEGPYYDEASNVLRFMDIEKNEIHTVDMAIGAASHKVHQTLDYAIGCSANVAGAPEEIVYGGAAGIGFLNLKTNEYGYSSMFWNEDEKAQGKEAYMRSNDGAVDPQGRFWVGTMCDPRRKTPGPEGVLFRMSSDLKLHRVLEKLSIPNGLSWTADGTTMYHTDTGTGEIRAYDWHGQTGSITNERVLFRAPEGCDGAPDGHAMDVEEHLWVAMFGASKVLRVSPKGEVVAEVTLPTRPVTCAVFVGEDLVITSAKEPEPERYPESAKHSGQVFKVHVGVQGKPRSAFRRS